MARDYSKLDPSLNHSDLRRRMIKVMMTKQLTVAEIAAASKINAATIVRVLGEQQIALQTCYKILNYLKKVEGEKDVCK